MSFLSQPITFQSLFGKKRTIGPINVQVVVSETTSDVLTITKQPVQQGASITDHAYKEPTTFAAQMLFQDDLSTSLSKIYQDLLDLQSNRQPFTIITPKRIYKNMLFASLGVTTDKNTENILSVSMAFQEVILVTIGVADIPRAQQKNPGATGKTQPAGKKSALVSLKEAGGTSIDAIRKLFQ